MRIPKKILANVINSLSDVQRESIFIYYFEHLSLSEIAQKMGVKENTVKGRLNLARTYIGKKIKALKQQGVEFCAVPLSRLNDEARLKPAAKPVKVSAVAGRTPAIAAAVIMMITPAVLMYYFKDKLPEKGDIHQNDSSAVYRLDSISDSSASSGKDLSSKADNSLPEYMDISSMVIADFSVADRNDNFTHLIGDIASNLQNVDTAVGRSAGGIGAGGGDNNGNRAETVSDGVSPIYDDTAEDEPVTDGNTEENETHENVVTLSFGDGSYSLPQYVYYGSDSAPSNAIAVLNVEKNIDENTVAITMMKLDISKNEGKEYDCFPVLLSKNDKALYENYDGPGALTEGNSFGTLSSSSRNGNIYELIYSFGQNESIDDLWGYRFPTYYFIRGIYYDSISANNADYCGEYGPVINGVQYAVPDSSNKIKIYKCAYALRGKPDLSDTSGIFAFDRNDRSWECVYRDIAAMYEVCQRDHLECSISVSRPDEIEAEEGSNYYRCIDDVLYEVYDSGLKLVWAKERNVDSFTFPDNIIGYSINELSKIQAGNFDYGNNG